MPEIANSFPPLYFQRNGGEDHRIPEWGEFFFNLGNSLEEIDIKNQRYTIALALPTRSYAAAFIGAGIACAKILLNSDDASEYVENLYSLPEGTSILYFDNGRRKKAIKKEVIEYNGIRLLGVQIEGHTTIYLKPENINKIELTQNNFTQLPNKQNGYAVPPPSDLAKAILGNRTHEFVYRTRIEGIVVGSRNSLQEEAYIELSTTLDSESNHFRGFLSDLFRVKGFNPLNVGHRFILQSPSANNPDIDGLQNIPANSPVLYDGALGFLKWKEMHSTRNWIIILNHTETHFSNAASQLNQDYIYRAEKQKKIHFPSIPSGMEVMFFMRDI